MEAHYIQFEIPQTAPLTAPPDGIAKKILKLIIVWLSKKTIPQQNPDFDEKIDDVKVWLLECDNGGIPLREVGLDRKGQVIAKMPYDKNYGYWTDNSMTLKDFKERFQAQDITHDFFELNEKAQKVFRINLNRLVIYITDWLPSAILLYSHVLHTTGK